jgi:hypothetical protein
MVIELDSEQRALLIQSLGMMAPKFKSKGMAYSAGGAAFSGDSYQANAEEMEALRKRLEKGGQAEDEDLGTIDQVLFSAKSELKVSDPGKAQLVHELHEYVRHQAPARRG